MIKVKIIAAAAIWCVLILAIPTIIYSGMSSETSESAVDSTSDPSYEPYDEEPAVDGGMGILSLGEYTTMDSYHVPCVTAQSSSAWDNTYPYDYINKIILGNAWGKVVQGGSRSAWADAYYDSASGDCGWADYAGQMSNDYNFVMYIGPVFSMDSANDYGGYWKYRLRVWEHESTNCTGATTSVGDVTKYAYTYNLGVGTTTWLQADYNTSTPSVYDVPKVVKNSGAHTGYRSYSYTVDATTCWDSACSTSASDSDNGCFYVLWY